MSRCASYTVGNKAERFDTRRVRVSLLGRNGHLTEVANSAELAELLRGTPPGPVQLEVSPRNDPHTTVRVTWDDRRFTANDPAQTLELLELQTRARARPKDWLRHARMDELHGQFTALDATITRAAAAELLAAGVTPNQLEHFHRNGHTDLEAVADASRRQVRGTDLTAWSLMGVTPSLTTAKSLASRGLTPDRIASYASVLSNGPSRVDAHRWLTERGEPGTRVPPAPHAELLWRNDLAAARYLHTLKVGPGMLQRELEHQFAQPSNDVPYFARLARFVSGEPGTTVLPYDYALFDADVTCGRSRVRIADATMVHALQRHFRSTPPSSDLSSLREVVRDTVERGGPLQMVSADKLKAVLWVNSRTLSTATWAHAVRNHDDPSSPAPTWNEASAQVRHVLAGQQCPTVERHLGCAPGEAFRATVGVCHGEGDHAHSAADVQQRRHFYALHPAGSAGCGVTCEKLALSLADQQDLQVDSPVLDQVMFTTLHARAAVRDEVSCTTCHLTQSRTAFGPTRDTCPQGYAPGSCGALAAR